MSVLTGIKAGAVKTGEEAMSEGWPIFEVRYEDRESFLIYADGRIKGFPNRSTVTNRIPGAISQARSEGAVKCAECHKVEPPPFWETKLNRKTHWIIRAFYFCVRVKSLVNPNPRKPNAPK